MQQWKNGRKFINFSNHTQTYGLNILGHFDNIIRVMVFILSVQHYISDYIHASNNFHAAALTLCSWIPYKTTA